MYNPYFSRTGGHESPFAHQRNGVRFDVVGASTQRCYVPTFHSYFFSFVVTIPTSDDVKGGSFSVHTTLN